MTGRYLPNSGAHSDQRMRCTDVGDTRAEGSRLNIAMKTIPDTVMICISHARITTIRSEELVSGCRDLNSVVDNRDVDQR